MSLLLGYDSETFPIKPGLLAPRMVCASWATRTEKGTGFGTDLQLREEGLSKLAGVLRDCALDDYVLVAHNATYDLGVACAEDPDLFLPLVFDAYRAGRVHCTMVRQMVLDVALGMRKFRRLADDRIIPANYGLADLVALYFNEHLEKEDTWRLKYGLLDGVPVEEWPQDAVDYAIRDAVEAIRVHEAQSAEMLEIFGGELPNQVEQQRAAWALHLMGMWGVRADQRYVDKFIAHCEEEIRKMREALGPGGIEPNGTGIFKKDGSRRMAEIQRRVVAACERLGVQVPMTDPSPKFPEGQVRTNKETLEETDDPVLHVLAESMSFAKHLGQWGPVVRAAVHRPVLARYNPLVETGRTSCGGSEGQEGTNFQNPPRKGDVRPCFVPRPGFVFGFTDADTIELRAHAQNCREMIGWSRLADIIIAQARDGGPDPHESLAAAILQRSAIEVQLGVRNGDKECNDARQFAKIPGYGFPGGLGEITFIAYAAGQMDKETFIRWFGVEPSERRAFARRIRAAWFETYPENHDYFDIVGRMIGDNGYGTVTQRMSGRIRGGVRFTAAANGFFQGRVADAMKEVLWLLADECYTGRCTDEHAHGGSNLCTTSGRSVLDGSRPSMFLHDEPILEHPEATASDRLERQRQIMVLSLNRWMPDVPCTSSGTLARRWWKGAKPIKVDGKIVPVRPEKVETGALDDKGKPKFKTIWVHDTEIRRAA